MAERLKIGVQLPEVEYAARWSDYLTMASIAEDIGLDSIWLGDHLLYREPDGTTTGPWECLSLLSAVAAVTSRVEIGPLVLATGFRNPAITAKMAETIDEISGGRLVLGLGAGWNQPEFEAFGVPFDNRLGRFTEAFNIIRHLLRYGEVSYNGIYHHLDACQIIPRGPRAGHIPIMIGSTGERMLRLTLPHVDAWNIWFADFANDPTRLAQHVQRMHGICDQLGRDPKEISKTAAVLLTNGDLPQRRRTGDSVRPVSGNQVEVADRLREFQAAGVDHIQLVLDPITPESIAWLAPVVDILGNSQA